MSRGYVSIVLHAHLPYVRHPEHQFHVEETWFHQAMIESYLPLLQVMHRLDDAQIPGKITLSLSTPLIAMMNDRLLLDRFDKHLDSLLDLVDIEVDRRRDDPDLAETSEFYKGRLQSLRAFWREDLARNLIDTFGRLHDSGRLELITTAGAHAILPLMHLASSRRAQIRGALDYFEITFGFRPRGIWLPECAFAAPLDAILAENDIEYTFVEGAGIRRGGAAPVYGNCSPVISKTGVVFFGRDELARAQVWDPEGYSSDPLYRDFDSDLVDELPPDIFKALFEADTPYPTGLKYRRITGTVPTDEKLPYHPEKARERAWEHGRLFVRERAQQVKAASTRMGDRPPHITCPFEAEFFGHWWYEGTHFLEAIFHHAQKHDEIELVTPMDYLDVVDVLQVSTPNVSSWGEGGYFAMWLDESNAWLYRYLHNAEITMRELVDENPDASGIIARALRQAGRELLLAQASDWLFVLRSGGSMTYALERVESHLLNFQTLADQVRDGIIDDEFLIGLERRHPIFPDLQWTAWGASSA